VGDSRMNVLLWCWTPSVPAALDVAAIPAGPRVAPMPDQVIGNRIAAFAVVRDTALTADQLARFCGTLLPKYMVPETFQFLPRLAETSTGKVDRQALRATGATT